MKTIRIEGFLIAKSPIFHGGDEKTGSETMLRRMKFFVGDKIIEIPYISGNAIRGYLRRLVMQDLLERVGYEIKNLKFYHALFSGGVLETVEEKAGTLDLELRKQIRDLLIPVSVFGFAYKNQVLEGKLVVGHALPICRELNDYLPEQTDKSIYEFLDWEFATRHEDIKTEKKEKEPKVQMIYRYEVFIPGTKFYHHFVLMDTTEIEDSFFVHMLNLWNTRNFVGGRSSTGLGEVELRYNIDNLPSAKIYLDFIQNNKDKIVALLRRLDEGK